MFERFVRARREPRRRWVGLTVAVSAVAHVAVALSLVVSSFWKIDRLLPRYSAVSFVATAMPPAPPPPPPAPPPPPKLPAKVVRVALGPLVQPPARLPPERTEEPAAQVAPCVDCVAGSTGSEPGGTGTDQGPTVLGPVTPILDTGKAPPPPVTAPAPQVVPAVMLNGNRIAGNDRPAIPDAVKQVMAVQGARTVAVAIKLCLSAQGATSSISFIARSAYAELDRAIESAVRGWRYRPWVVNGRAVPVCTSVTFSYRLE